MKLVESIHRVLETTAMRRVRRGLGGSHTVVTYPPLDALDPLDEHSEEPFHLVPPQGPLHYYMHIAFCEHICSFCHYTKTRHTPGRPSPEANDYIPALLDEAAERRRELAGSDVSSIYLGGGTPTALEPAQLRPVMDTVASLAGSRKPAICVEVSPITMAAGDGREKLDMLLDYGVTRISLGVQTFDPALLPALRHHDQPLLLRTLDMLTATRASINIDLIQDIAGQTRASIENDLRFVARYQPDQVSWYVLRAHAASSFSKRLGSGAERPIGDVESALRRARIIEGMEQLGYSWQAGGRFTRCGKGDNYKAVRGGVDSHLLGLGVSAYSHGWGWFFRNTASTSSRLAIRDYIRRIGAGRHATSWATRITEEERYAGQLCQMSREHVPADMLARDTEAAAEARETLATLVDAGLIAGDQNEGWSPTPLGRLFEEEIASLFYSVRSRSRLEEAGAYWASGKKKSASIMQTSPPVEHSHA